MISGTGKVITGVMKTAAVAVGAGVTAFSALTTSALNAAGDLEQNMGGSEAVFKEYAESMQDTAVTAYKSMGLSASDFLATANKMGALMQGSGLGIEESAELSAKAMQRAADVASIMGIDVSSAMESVAGAAKGNFTMMDNLGVAMNATTLEAYALSQGIETAYAEMDNATKVQLAMQMFLEKTEYATGNYAKENETLAGALTTAKAALTNFLSGAGDADQLVESLVGAAEVIVKNLVDIVPRLADGLSEIAAGLTPYIGPILESLLPAVIEGATALINGLVAALPDVISALSEVIPSIIDTILTMMPLLLDAGIQIITGLLNGITESLPQIITAAVAIVDKLIVSLTELLPQILEMGVQLIVQLAAGLAEALPGLIPQVVEIVFTIVDTLLDNIDLLMDATVELILALALGLIDALPMLIERVPEIIIKLTDAFAMYADKLSQAALQFIAVLAKGLIESLPVLVNNIPKIVEAVVSTFIAQGRSFFSIGKNIVLGIYNGLKDNWSSIVSWFKNVCDDLLDSVKDLFGIHSPSTEFAWIAKMCIAGFDEPLEDYNPYDTLQKSMKANIGTLRSSFAEGYTNGAFGRSAAIDYDRLAEANVDAFTRAGISIRISNREMGRIVREVQFT